MIAGHVQPANAASLSLVLSDGRRIPVPFGAQHFYVIDLTGADAAEVRSHGVALVAADAAGTELARTTVPADWDASAQDVAKETTIDVTTRSDGSDFTKVLGIDGVLRDPLPASLQLVYDDSHTADIALEPDGSFHYDVPADRQADFMTPRRLVGRDAQGRIVVDRPVAAVAYWRAPVAVKRRSRPAKHDPSSAPSYPMMLENSGKRWRVAVARSRRSRPSTSSAWTSSAVSSRRSRVTATVRSTSSMRRSFRPCARVRRSLLAEAFRPGCGASSSTPRGIIGGRPARSPPNGMTGTRPRGARASMKDSATSQRRSKPFPSASGIAVFLRYYADLDYQQIGEVLGIATGTVSATLSAAHRTLHTQLDEVPR